MTERLTDVEQRRGVLRPIPLTAEEVERLRDSGILARLDYTLPGPHDEAEGER
jgi:hypothetical protein